MKILIVAMLAVIVSVTSTAPLSAQSDTICQLERATARAFVAHDRAFLEGIFADDFQHTNYRGGVANKADEVQFFTSPSVQMGAATIDSCTVRTYGDVAIATGVTTWTHVLAGKNDLSGAYSYTRVYYHRDGRWQIVTSHFSKVVSS
jgi:hypothetical protein